MKLILLNLGPPLLIATISETAGIRIEETDERAGTGMDTGREIVAGAGTAAEIAMTKGPMSCTHGIAITESESIPNLVRRRTRMGKASRSRV